MAKQTFTTGQVLTAAQMTSLQQTAMGGGSATAKTASYVLVAADAGATVIMNSASATTITVNTGLFAAGDTVFIQNLGAGNCTVTAGTATVATAGSLILPQNDAGILYFTATGTSIFYDYIQAGAVSPLTTKGDLYTFSTSDARLGVGANNTILVADSAEATGLKWAAPAGGGMTLINTFAMSAVSSLNMNNIFSSTYSRYRVLIYTTQSVADWINLRLRVSGSDNTTSSYYGSNIRRTGGANTGTDAVATTGWSKFFFAAQKLSTISFDIMNPFSSSLNTVTTSTFGAQETVDAEIVTGTSYGLFNANTSFDGLSLISTGTMTGEVKVYGYPE